MSISKFIFNSTLWIPHITKTFVIFLFLLSIVLRGIIRPLSTGTKLNFLFPINWLYVGFIGLSLDIFKAPGYLLGAIYDINNQNRFKSGDKENLLFVCPYPYDVQAGQRIKFERHYEKLKENYDLNYDYFIDYKTWKTLYKKGNVFLKFKTFFISSIRRLYLIKNLKNYDIVYVHMWVHPNFFSFYEVLYRYFSNKIIFDVEDNVLLNSKKTLLQSINPLNRSEKKYLYQVTKANYVIASSPYLEDVYKKINEKKKAIFIPPTLDQKVYSATKLHYKKETLIIGWTGTHSTKKYLNIVEPYLKIIAKKRNIKFSVIGNFDYYLEDVNYEVIKWNKETEIYDLLNFDIGIYPIHTDEWSLGKSGLKCLQYMALGIPSVSTDYGSNSRIVKNGYNGYLIDNDQWEEYLTKLIDSEILRKKIGLASKEYVFSNYSVEALNNKYSVVIDS